MIPFPDLILALVLGKARGELEVLASLKSRIVVGYLEATIPAACASQGAMELLGVEQNAQQVNGCVGHSSNVEQFFVKQLEGGISPELRRNWCSCVACGFLELQKQ